MDLFSPAYFAPTLHYANLFLCSNFSVFHLCNYSAHAVSVPPSHLNSSAFAQVFPSSLFTYLQLSFSKTTTQISFSLIQSSASINMNAALFFTKYRSTSMMLQSEAEQKERRKLSTSAFLLGVQARPRLGQSCNSKNLLKLEHANIFFGKLSNIQEVYSGSI